MHTFISDISKKEFPISERISLKSIRSSLLESIRNLYPEVNVHSVMALSELNAFREKFISESLSAQLGALTALESRVLESLSDKSTLTDKLENDDDVNITFGQRVADQVASFGGSWTFIITFAIIIFCWILLNVYWLNNKGFDPYPFILLNLILSCLAALQAPIIMMSQNRQEEKDRERVKRDYMINLKSELEIRLLHEKIDHLIIHQQHELLEIQKIQIDMMNDILNSVNKEHP